MILVVCEDATIPEVALTVHGERGSQRLTRLHTGRRGLVALTVRGA